jgi:hypothetical protein
MRVRFKERWIAESENILLLFEPSRYPVSVTGFRQNPTDFRRSARKPA